MPLWRVLPFRGRGRIASYTWHRQHLRTVTDDLITVDVDYTFEK